MNVQKLAETAAAMVAPGKGVLAIDESLPTIAKRFATIDLESTEENRRAYRELLIMHPAGAEFISGMILFDETLRQATAEGKAFPRVLEDQGVLVGIKVDRGAKALAGHPGEKVTEGLDGLRERLREYAGLGARFAKWRAVVGIGEHEHIPSRACIRANVHALARYAALCQEADIVPMVEPEVLMDGGHDIQTCYQVSLATLQALFEELYRQDVSLEHTVLKVNMVVPGKECARQAELRTVADETVRCLLNAVPAAVPGIVFLSGGQSPEMATRHLNEMNQVYRELPWPLSFSYGRALQEPCLSAWAGRAANVSAAQAALLHRERCNSMACLGRYSADMEQEAA